MTKAKYRVERTATDRVREERMRAEEAGQGTLGGGSKPAGPPSHWREDLSRMKGGEVQVWFIWRSRDWLLAQRYIEPVLDGAGLWMGDRITPAGLQAVAEK